jgi:hypothetical protein
MLGAILPSTVSSLQTCTPPPLFAHLPSTMALRLPAVADSSGPASMGSAHSVRPLLRPSLSAMPAPPSEPAVAPASTLLTTCRHDGGGGGIGVHEGGYEVTRLQAEGGLVLPRG